MSMKQFIKDENTAMLFGEVFLGIMAEHGIEELDKGLVEAIANGCVKQYNQNIERFISYMYERDTEAADKVLALLKEEDEAILVLFSMSTEVITMLTAYQAAFLVAKDWLEEKE